MIWHANCRLDEQGYCVPETCAERQDVMMACRCERVLEAKRAEIARSNAMIDQAFIAHLDDILSRIRTH